jgi:hypothetical protein
MRRNATIVLVILGLALATGADDFWVKKDWKTWSKAECKKMLEDSPWAKRSLIENSISNRQLPSGNNDVTHTPGSGSNIGAGEIDYYVQLLSAAPVREALIRQNQIEQKYETMNDASRKAFDGQMEQQMGRISDHDIVVRVSFETTNAALEAVVADYWHNVPPNTIPANVYLVTGRGTNVPPSTFALVKGADTKFDFTFPRIVGAEPVIAPDTKSMKVQFPNPAFGDFPAKTVAAEYKVDKMMWNGKVTY